MLNTFFTTSQATVWLFLNFCEGPYLNHPNYSPSNLVACNMFFFTCNVVFFDELLVRCKLPNVFTIPLSSSTPTPSLRWLAVDHSQDRYPHTKAHETHFSRTRRHGYVWTIRAYFANFSILYTAGFFFLYEKDHCTLSMIPSSWTQRFRSLLLFNDRNSNHGIE